jgi:hypothetical protein
LTAFPPEDLSGFLQLSGGEWLALRSLLGPESPDPGLAPDGATAAERGTSQPWHQSDRGELRVAVLASQSPGDWGGLEVAPPGGGVQRLVFLRDGTLRMNEEWGRWQFATDGTLELELVKGERVVRERVWFSKPNLRLRCTLEQSLDGQPGRASFSSEIRRIQRPREASPTTQA